MAASTPQLERRSAPTRRRLSRGECRAWLAQHDEGRLGYRTGRGPRSLVIRYAVADDGEDLRIVEMADTSTGYALIDLEVALAGGRGDEQYGVR